MGAVAYTSTFARRKQYLKGVAMDDIGIKNSPLLETGEVREIFGRGGYTGKNLEQATKMIANNPTAWLAFMMSYELNPEPVSASESFTSFLIVLGSTVFGSLIPLVPYFLLGGALVASAIVSVIASGSVSFFVGYHEAKTTVGSIWRSGLQMAMIGLAAGIAGFLIGHLIEVLPQF